MRFIIFRLLAPALLALGLSLKAVPAGAVVATPFKPERIWIHSLQKGRGSKEATLEITRQSSTAASMDVLAAAAQAPRLMQLDLENLGVTSAWVSLNSTALIGIPSSPARKAVLVSAVKDWPTIERAVKGYYTGTWTDDAPSITVELSGAGRKITLVSNSQKQFMLPWSVSGAQTYDARISRALAQVLPPDFLNRARVMGQHFSEALNEQLEVLLRAELERTEADNSLGSQLDPIRARFKITESLVAYVSALEYEMDGWHGTLSGGALASGVLIEAHLPVEDKSLLGVEAFLARLPAVLGVVSKAKWLMAWLLAHPNARAKINMVVDKSVSAKVRMGLDGDFQSHGKSELAAKVAAHADESVFLTIAEAERVYSRWVVLPDGSMVLWHARGPQVLKWAAAELGKGWDFAGHTAYGVEISPAGELLPPGR